LASLVESNAQAVDGAMLRRLSLAADRVQNHLYGMQREIEELSRGYCF